MSSNDRHAGWRRPRAQQPQDEWRQLHRCHATRHPLLTEGLYCRRLLRYRLALTRSVRAGSQ